MAAIPIRVPVVRHKQKGQIAYLGHLTAAQAKQVTFADEYPPAPGRVGYQRPADRKRALAFANYVAKEPSGFITPILLNARSEVSFIGSGNIPDTGQLEIPEGARIAIVDGQHRSLGVQEFLKDPSSVLPFMLFDQLDVTLEEQLFITINREQKRVSMSHVRFVGRLDDPIAELASRLEADPDSPWYGRVNLIGAKGMHRPVRLQSLCAALSSLLQAGEIKTLPTDDQYRLAVSFWRLVAEVWVDAWQNPKTSLLTSSMGTLAVAKMGGFLLPQYLVKNAGVASLDVSRLQTRLMRARGVDWGRNGPFRGKGGRGGADDVKDVLDRLIFETDGGNRTAPGAENA